MRRNSFFRVLLVLSVIQAIYVTAFAQIIIPEKKGVISQSQTSASSTPEPPVTQFILSKNTNLDDIDSDDDEDDYSSEASSLHSKEVDYQSAEASSLLPRNFSDPKLPYKKPKIVLTLSLRSKDKENTSNVGKKPSSKNRSPFLFGNNVIRYDTRTNRLIIPTSSSDSSLEIGDADEDSFDESDYDALGGTTLISVITEGPLLEVQNETLRALKILDKLRTLTNGKLKVPKKSQKEATYGFKMYETLHPKLAALKSKSEAGKQKFNHPDAQASNRVSTTSTEPVSNLTTVEYTTMTSKVGGHMKQNVTLAADSSTVVPQRGPPRIFFPDYPSTTPIVLKIGKLAINSKFQNHSSVETSSSVPQAYKLPPDYESSSGRGSSREQINTGETRLAITADQVGGNRPTHRPFHHAPTTQPPLTTTTEKRVKNFYQKVHSPHNHAYAPTQDPVSIAHNEDLNVEDFQDFRVANLVFGSKVGSDVPQNSPPASAPRPPPTSGRNNIKHNEISYPEEESEEVYDERPALPVRLLQENVKKRAQVIIRTTPPTTTTTTTTTRPPVFITERKRPGLGIKNVPHTRIPPSSQLQASSGVKNAQLLVQNDNLPFYKEPGGVFKEHQSQSYNADLGDSDEDTNFIAHSNYNDNRPGVKYAPKPPSAQTQSQTVYANRQHPENHYGSNNPRHNHHPQQIHHNPQYLPVTQAPIYVQQQPLLHQVNPQQYAVYPAPTPTTAVIIGHPHHPHQALHQRPQQQPIYYHQQPVAAPTPYYPVLPTQSHQPLFQNPGPAAGFVPLLHPQSYRDTQPVQAPPVQPIYQTQHEYSRSPQRSGNFPHRNDPHSDTFFGDPTPDTEGGSKRGERPPASSKPNPARKRPNNRPQQQNNDYHSSEEDRSYENQRPPPPPPPQPSRRQQGHRPRRPENEDSRERYNNDNDDEGSDHSGSEDVEDREKGGRDREENYNNNKNRNDNNRHKDNNGRRQNENGGRANRNNNNFDDYNPAKESGFPGDDDDVEPNYNNQRPVFDDAPGKNRGGRNHGGENNQPFRPSPQDYGPIRPSNKDFNRAKFDHPNIQYPQGQQRHQNYNDGPEYDPRGFGVGHGPSPSNNVQLDPIYTRTIKQYDDENRQKEKEREPDEPPSRHNSQRPSGPRGNDEEDHDDEREERRPPPKRNDDEEDENPRSGRRDEEEEERPSRGRDEEEEERPSRVRDEEEEERPSRGRDEEEERPRQSGDDEEEEERPRRGDNEEERPQREDDGEEQEEESKNPPVKSKDDEEEEEEEEEEEQEKPPRNRQRNPQKKKPSKKRPRRPPPNEKSGDLEDDISAIDREFGGVFGSSGKQPVVFQTPVTGASGVAPVASSPGQLLLKAQSAPNVASIKAIPVPVHSNHRTEYTNSNINTTLTKSSGSSFAPTSVILDL